MDIAGWKRLETRSLVKHSQKLVSKQQKNVYISFYNVCVCLSLLYRFCIRSFNVFVGFEEGIVKEMYSVFLLF